MTEIRKEKPRHLGRGLQSLIGPIMSHVEDPTVRSIADHVLEDKFPPDKDLQESLRQLELSLIRPNPYQARTVWDEQELADLASSIRTNGVIQPIVVRPAGTGYQLVAGERRFRASQIAGLLTIPAWVRRATDEQMHEWALVENIHRVDLSPIDRATAYQTYINAFSLTQAEAAQRLGQDRSVVTNYLRLLDLPQDIRQMLVDGQLSMGHARAMLALPTDEMRRKLANRAMAGRLSVREVERLVRRCLTGSTESRSAAKDRPAHIADLEHRLSSQLGTKVIIEARKNGQRGRIIIEFYSLDEFDGIAEKLGVSCEEQI